MQNSKCSTDSDSHEVYVFSALRTAPTTPSHRARSAKPVSRAATNKRLFFDQTLRSNKLKTETIDERRLFTKISELMVKIETNAKRIPEGIFTNSLALSFSSKNRFRPISGQKKTPSASNSSKKAISGQFDFGSKQTFARIFQSEKMMDITIESNEPTQKQIQNDLARTVQGLNNNWHLTANKSLAPEESSKESQTGHQLSGRPSSAISVYPSQRRLKNASNKKNINTPSSIWAMHLTHNRTLKQKALEIEGSQTLLQRQGATIKQIHNKRQHMRSSCAFAYDERLEKSVESNVGRRKRGGRESIGSDLTSLNPEDRTGDVFAKRSYLGG